MFVLCELRGLCGCSIGPAEQTQAPDAAVGIDVEPHVRDVADAPQLVFEDVPRVRLERRARQELSPLATRRGRASFAGRALEAAGARRVALEVARVDFDPPNRARGPEPDDRPVVPRPAPPLRLPAVAHVRRVARHDQVVARAEEHVAARDDQAAVLDRREIDVAAARAAGPSRRRRRRGRAGARRRRRERCGAAGASRAGAPVDRRTGSARRPSSGVRGRISRHAARDSSSAAGDARRRRTRRSRTPPGSCP